MYAEVPAPVRMTRASGLSATGAMNSLQLRVQAGQQRVRTLQHVRLLLDLARGPQRAGRGQLCLGDAQVFELSQW